MTDKKIAGFLKQLRKTSELSASEVVEKLKNYDINISAKTLYGYESGLSMLNADVFVALCRIYKCDNPMDIFENVSIRPSEVSMIEKYRSLDPFGQETVNIVLNREAERTEQVRDLAESSSDSNMRIYAYLNKIACAGTGFFFDDIPANTIEAPYMEGADFVIGVSGNSMEPLYQDGDMLYVKKVEHLVCGDIGIFTINNECFLKELGEDGLISLNEKYDKIPGTEDVRLVGKVIGKFTI